MNRAGVPDEHMIDDRGRAVWIELKAVARWPVRSPTNALEHRFSGPQLTFMRRVDAAGGRALGVVGWEHGAGWRCAALRVHDIGAQGTLSRDDIDRVAPHLDVSSSDAAAFAARFMRLVTRC